MNPATDRSSPGRALLGLRVAAVVLNWNGGATLLQCLEVLLRASPDLDQVVVVDNGSTDGSPERVEDLFPRIDLVRNDGNLGYAEGNNRGIRRAIERGADAVLILNNDVFVTDGFLEPLVDALVQSEEIGLVGPKVRDAEHPEMLWCAGADVTFGRNVSRLRGHRQRDDGRWDRSEDVDYLPGAAVLVARRVIEKIGLFDPLFFCYMEDVDFCVRAREAGFRIRYVAESSVLHRASSSTGGGYTAKRKYMNAVNSVHFMRRHGTLLRWLRFLLADVATVPLAVLAALPRGEARAAIAKGKGLVDGFRGRRVTGPSAGGAARAGDASGEAVDR